MLSAAVGAARGVTGCEAEATLLHCQPGDSDVGDYACCGHRLLHARLYQQRASREAQPGHRLGKSFILSFLFSLSLPKVVVKEN